MRKSSRDETFDVVIVGGGIFGLSCAQAALATGRSVCVLEAVAPGAGASGGVVGALSPHLPLGWNEKKQVQLDSLVSAEAFWRAVEAAPAALSAGYGRVGRYLPIRDQAERGRMAAQAAGARENWPERFAWEIVASDALPAWIDPEACPFGAVHETLSARLHPRQAVAALEAAVSARGGVVRYPAPVRSVAAGRVTLADGVLGAGAIVLAAGLGGAALAPGTMGRGVKGQAALLDVESPPDAMLYADGLYVVPHADGTVAVGSTSEREFADPHATDTQLDDLLARAERVCPPLRGARVIERWAGVRPRGVTPDPMVGPLPGQPCLFVANGGFKTGFGFAPVIGEAVAQMISGQPHWLPDRFLPPRSRTGPGR